MLAYEERPGSACAFMNVEQQPDRQSDKQKDRAALGSALPQDMGYFSASNSARFRKPPVAALHIRVYVVVLTTEGWGGAHRSG